MTMPALREMPVTERPAVRLVTHGANSLSTAELVSIIIGGPKALENAHELMAKVGGSLRRLARLFVADTEKVVGGLATAKKLSAALELGRRLACEVTDDGTPMRSPREVALLFAPRLEDLPVEEFHVAILDSQHRLERDILITRGTLTSTLIHPREVFREAIAERAAAIIIVHNHPSGDPTPSAEDRAITEQLVAAGKLLDIPVHDHIVIGRGRYASFAEAGLL